MFSARWMFQKFAYKYEARRWGYVLAFGLVLTLLPTAISYLLYSVQNLPLLSTKANTFPFFTLVFLMGILASLLCSIWVYWRDYYHGDNIDAAEQYKQDNGLRY